MLGGPGYIYISQHKGFRDCAAPCLKTKEFRDGKEAAVAATRIEVEWRGPVN